ncbi:hemerythrin domain-containing protein [Streptomyces sp. ISL-22]|uniref:Hemerythrin n=1 Tax=Streptomyces curacoi TaxID=146536 RepID=A0A124H478_9ACTN|nr:MULTISPECIES: hemerythrin domain-containing protein [Streptomyces]KUM78016.1 hemerythrin [Streptomyces curacoi]MBT2416361.1 hemerythrin domain-containing protein [Streptomyces sp. ISL-24]MBT2434160.1 hemerythrin domain-containing protein [Streptomyces sp. ISL-22]
MGHGGNVIQELTADHREVDALFAQMETHAGADPKRRELADHLTMELVRHSVAEEEHLYPAVRRYVDGGDDLADKEIADHSEVERLLKELEDRQPGDAEFDTLIAQLKSSVAAHVRDEEDRLFHLLADACPPETLDELGEKVRKAKETAPTRPHPAAPDTPPLNKLLAPGTGMVDRLRDALTGRGKQD